MWIMARAASRLLVSQVPRARQATALPASQFIYSYSFASIGGLEFLVAIGFTRYARDKKKSYSSTSTSSPRSAL
jgi:hypothetical protein